MKDALRKQRELCFKAWAANKSAKFPKHLWNHYYDVIISAPEPEYKEPNDVLGIALGAISGALVASVIFLFIV